ncbi:MAG: hypothetical protein ABSH34_19050 [Verrucomicrobiota bacterium]|jgi:hypothetical protein
MSKFVKLLRFAGILAGVVLAGVLLGWLGSGGLGSQTGAPEGVFPGLEPGNAKAVARPGERLAAGALVSRPPDTAPGMPESAAASDLISNWEDRVDEILTSAVPEADKAKKMLEMFPRLPEGGQAEVARHLANLVSDQDYPSLGRYLTNSALPESVLDVLVADVLNRPNSVKLPALLGVARDPQNPKAGEAKDILHLFLEEDYGTDWNTWQAKVDQWLKDNPD